MAYSGKPVVNLGMAPPDDVAPAGSGLQLASIDPKHLLSLLTLSMSKPLNAPVQIPEGRASILPAGLPPPFLENFYEAPALWGKKESAPREKLAPRNEDDAPKKRVPDNQPCGRLQAPLPPNGEVSLPDHPRALKGT